MMSRARCGENDPCATLGLKTNRSLLNCDVWPACDSPPRNNKASSSAVVDEERFARTTPSLERTKPRLLTALSPSEP
jgi:hypothetical protein